MASHSSALVVSVSRDSFRARSLRTTTIPTTTATRATPPVVMPTASAEKLPVPFSPSLNVSVCGARATPAALCPTMINDAAGGAGWVEVVAGWVVTVVVGCVGMVVVCVVVMDVVVGCVEGAVVC